MLVYVVPFLEAAVLPPGLFILIGIAALILLLLRLRRAALLLGLVDLLLLYLLSILPVSNLLIGPLERRYPPFDPVAAAQFHPDYVVALGGGIVPRSPDAEGAGSLGAQSLKRLVYAAEIARSMSLPLIVSGGIVPASPAPQPEAAVAAATVRRIGITVPRVLEETRSRNTWENAFYVEKEFHPARVILVTSAFHMARSVIAFRRQGIAVIPAPTDYLAQIGPFVIYDLLPGASALEVSAIAIKEYIGILDYSLRR